MANTPQAEASFCNQIPLHQTNLIQPHGVLIVAELRNLSVIQVSSNIAELLSMDADSITGIPLQQFLEATCYTHLLQNISQRQFEVSMPFMLTFRYGNQALSFIHEKDGCLLVEIQLKQSSQPENFFEIFFIRVQQFISTVNQLHTLDEIVKVAAKEIKHISGFDKVMIYSFDEEWNGLVVAEEMEEGMDAYLGLKFPPTDIPRQARELYLKNPYRIIPNREYEPVPMVPAMNSSTGQPADLSNCKFRSVLPVHLEYLKNMNVCASMSTRIIHKEKLWGLIACHHRTPKYLSFQECFVFEYISNIISSRIASISFHTASQRSDQLDRIFQDINTDIWKQNDPASSLVSCKKELRALLGAEGIVISWQGRVDTEGKTPSQQQLGSLLEWLQQENFSQVIQFNSLSNEYPPAKEFAGIASGLLLLPIQPYEGNYILAFRAEELEHVEWGGNPNEVLRFEKENRNYHPRNSFRVWKETVQFRAVPWDQQEMKIAQRLRNSLVELTLRALAKNLEHIVKERTRELENSKRELEATIDDWSQIIHVATHDLQEPARKITLYTSRVVEKVKEEEAGRFVLKLQDASKRISSLLRNLLNYSRISQQHVKEKLDLNQLIEEVISDFELLIEEKNAKIEVDKLTEVEAVPEQLRQVFSSLVSNSLRFHKEEPRIRISGYKVGGLNFDLKEDKEGQYFRVSVKDNGIGFSDQHAVKIFQLFQKLNTHEFETGVGIGLSVAKKIIEKHGGIIMARGKEQEGAEFIFIIPLR